MKRAAVIWMVILLACLASLSALAEADAVS